MANSYYRVLEIRVLDETDDEPIHIYIRISDANDFMPIAGWYYSPLPKEETSLAFIGKTLGSQSFLSWQRKAPPTRQ